MGIPETYSRIKLNALYRAIPLKDTTFRLLRKYFSAAANLYGIISLRKLFEIVDAQNPGLITKEMFIEFAKVARHEQEGYFLLCDADIFQGGKQTPFLDYEIIDTTLLEIDISRYNHLKKVQSGKPYYIPNKKDFLLYANPFHFEEGEAVTAIRSFLKDYLQLEEKLEHVIYGMLFFGSKCLNISFETLLKKLEENGVVINKKEDLQVFSRLYSSFCEQTRMQSHRGHTPKEMTAITEERNRQEAVIPWASPRIADTKDGVAVQLETSVKKQKIGRNDRCPCGSGKKYKRCCGLG